MESPGIKTALWFKVSWSRGISGREVEEEGSISSKNTRSEVTRSISMAEETTVGEGILVVMDGVGSAASGMEAGTPCSLGWGCFQIVSFTEGGLMYM